MSLGISHTYVFSHRIWTTYYEINKQFSKKIFFCHWNLAKIVWTYFFPRVFDTKNRLKSKTLMCSFNQFRSCIMTGNVFTGSQLRKRLAEMNFKQPQTYIWRLCNLFSFKLEYHTYKVKMVEFLRYCVC